MLGASFNFNRLVTSLNLSWSISTLVALILLVSPLLGLVVGESRLKRTTLAVFVGIVLAQMTAAPIFNFIVTWHWQFLKYLTVPRLSLLIFILALVLLNLGPLPKHQTAQRLGLRLMVLSFLLVTLLICSIMTFLPDGTHRTLIDHSSLLHFFDNSRVAWIATAAVWLMILNLWPEGNKNRK